MAETWDDITDEQIEESIIGIAQASELAHRDSLAFNILAYWIKRPLPVNEISSTAVKINSEWAERFQSRRVESVVNRLISSGKMVSIQLGRSMWLELG